MLQNVISRTVVSESEAVTATQEVNGFGVWIERPENLIVFLKLHPTRSEAIRHADNLAAKTKRERMAPQPLGLSITTVRTWA